MDAVLTLADVEAAAQRIDGVAHRTPVVTSRAIDEIVGARAFFKCENLQRAGAFKIRGAYNAISQLSRAQLDRGVAAYSSGNHAQAVALAARLLGSRAVILMPRDTPELKLGATRGYGADVVLYDRYTEDRVALGTALAAERGLTLIPPYEDLRVMAGQGTAALELLRETGPLDALLVPIGGGGLMAGCAVAATATCPGIRMIGVEPVEGDDTKRSLAAGARVRIPVARTIADGQAADTPGELTFSINQTLIEQIVLVSDDEIRAAMILAFERLKLVLEPSGASALAALLSGRIEPRSEPRAEPRPERIGVVLSGGNVGARRFAELIAASSSIMDSPVPGTAAATGVARSRSN